MFEVEIDLKMSCKSVHRLVMEKQDAVGIRYRSTGNAVLEASGFDSRVVGVQLPWYKVLPGLMPPRAKSSYDLVNTSTPASVTNTICSACAARAQFCERQRRVLSTQKQPLRQPTVPLSTPSNRPDKSRPRDCRLV